MKLRTPMSHCFIYLIFISEGCDRADPECRLSGPQIVNRGPGDDGNQFFRVEKGEGEIWIDGVVSEIKSDTAMIVPAGERHESLR